VGEEDRRESKDTEHRREREERTDERREKIREWEVRRVLAQYLNIVRQIDR
tara:strand:+ start:312 stop:464 length:153 start_codon:yes stop_codon:yes gene_type:complete